MVKNIRELKLHIANLDAILTSPNIYLTCSEDVINAKLDLQDFEKVFHNFNKEAAKYLDTKGKNLK